MGEVLGLGSLLFLPCPDPCWFSFHLQVLVFLVFPPQCSSSHSQMLWSHNDN